MLTLTRTHHRPPARIRPASDRGASDRGSSRRGASGRAASPRVAGLEPLESRRLLSVAVAATAEDVIKINFQTPQSSTPSGYGADTGQTFGARSGGLTYGWNQSATGFTRDRNVTSDQRFDTLVHMQQYGNRTWELAVPNGTYSVFVMAGDPQYFDSVYRINVEGELTVNGTPSSGDRFISGTQTVEVTDGRLTVTNAAGAKNNKLAFIEITPQDVTEPPPPPPGGQVNINFQPAGAETPEGYLADTGQVFGERAGDFQYGWDQSATGFTRDRDDDDSLDQRFDTLIHTQQYGNRTWEIALANGTYAVHLVAGDPQYPDGNYRYNVEGTLAVNGAASSDAPFVEGHVTVTVADGRLTISNAEGAFNNKLAFLEIAPA